MRKQLVWKERPGEACFYSSMVRLWVTGRGMVDMVLQGCYGLGGGLALFSVSCRASWRWWRVKWRSTSVWRRACTVGARQAASSSPAAAGHGRASKVVREVRGVTQKRKGVDRKSVV